MRERPGEGVKLGLGRGLREEGDSNWGPAEGTSKNRGKTKPYLTLRRENHLVYKKAYAGKGGGPIFLNRRREKPEGGKRHLP